MTNNLNEQAVCVGNANAVAALEETLRILLDRRAGLNTAIAAIEASIPIVRDLDFVSPTQPVVLRSEQEEPAQEKPKKTRKPYQKMTMELIPEDDEILKSMAAEGASLKDIAKMGKWHHLAVMHRLKALGITILKQSEEPPASDAISEEEEVADTDDAVAVATIKAVAPPSPAPISVSSRSLVPPSLSVPTPKKRAVPLTDAQALVLAWGIRIQGREEGYYLDLQAVSKSNLAKLTNAELAKKGEAAHDFGPEWR